MEEVYSVMCVYSSYMNSAISIQVLDITSWLMPYDLKLPSYYMRHKKTDFITYLPNSYQRLHGLHDGAMAVVSDSFSIWDKYVLIKILLVH